MKPLISIVIPAYNRAGTIIKAVKSIQQQTYQNWELIIVDDGSKDPTAEILKPCLANDHRISYLVHDCNKGAQAARNTGIKAAKGEWVAFLDSDDQWLPESLEVRLNAALEKKVAVLYTPGYIQHVNKPIEVYHLPKWEGFIFHKVLTKEGPMFQSLLVRREALEKIGFLDENVVAFQEWDTSIRLAKENSYGYINEPTFIYDYTTLDAISRNSIRNGKGYSYIIRKFFVEILRYAGTEGLIYHYDVISKWYQEGGDLKNSKAYKLKSLFWKLLTPKIIIRKIINLRKNRTESCLEK